MIKNFNDIKNDELVKGSMVLFAGIVIFNILNYIFQIGMANMLGPADFGILAALMSIIYILSIPGEAIQTVISKYTSKFMAKNESGKIKSLMLTSARKGFILALITFIIICILSLLFADNVKIEAGLLIVTGLFSFYVFLVPIGRGILQGEKKFNGFGISLILEGIVKVCAGLLLVFFGFKVYGAIGGILLSCLFSFFIVFGMLKNIFSNKSEKEEFKGLYRGSIPILVAITAIVLMYSIDIFIAKMIFDPEIAGQYAFVSLIGKVIIFISSSIGRAMLPLTSEKYEMGTNTFSTFKKSFFIVLVMSIISLIFYYTIPEFIIWVVSLGKDIYLPASGILFELGVSYSLLSLSYIIILYKISINKMKMGSFILIGFAAIQAILLFMNGSSIDNFADAFLLSNLIIALYSIFLIFKK